MTRLTINDNIKRKPIKALKSGTFFVVPEDFKNMSIKKLWLKVDCCAAVNFSKQKIIMS